MNRTRNDSPVAEKRYVSTAQVAHALGVSVTTVKRWVDDGVMPAYRTVGGHRKLVMADVLRLVRSGHLPQADLARLDPRSAAADTAEPEELARRLAAALREGDAGLARAVIHGAYHSGMPVEVIADGVVSPAMQQLGHDWETGRIDVLHEHRGTQVCAAALYELKALVEAHADRERPVAVGGSPEHDHYFLANLLAQTSLTDAGWDAINLGPHTPMRSFEAALAEFRPRLVWLSVSYLPDPAKFAAEYRDFYKVAERANVAVAIGGRGLSGELRAVLPYTTFGDGFRQLVAFANTLHRRPSPPRRGRPPVVPPDDARD